MSVVLGGASANFTAKEFKEVFQIYPWESLVTVRKYTAGMTEEELGIVNDSEAKANWIAHVARTNVESEDSGYESQGAEEREVCSSCAKRRKIDEEEQNSSSVRR